MKTKRIISAIMALAMIVSMMGVNVYAEESTTFVGAKIGENSYETLAAAIEVANDTPGAVKVEIYGEVEFTDGMELKGSYDSITFVGKGTDAQITIKQTAGGDYLEAHGKIVAFTGLSLAKANPAWSGNSGHMGNYFSIQGGTVTYTNCTFPNGACTSGGTATYTDCTFENASEYGLWVYDDALVTVDGGTIDSKKGIKVYSEDETSVTSTLTVQNATFTDNVTAKPAIAIGYAESITLSGNTYNNTTAMIELDSSSDADCNGIIVNADNASSLTVVDRQGGAECGVLVGNRIYMTVADAAEVATSGSAVTLLHNSTETVELPEGVILDKNGYTADSVTVAQPATPAPSGSINGGLVNVQDANRTFLTIESWITYANESIVVKVYDANGTLLVTSTLIDNERVILGKENWGGLSTMVGINCTDDWWSTVWEEGKLRADYVPAKATLFVDGIEMNTANIQMRAAGTETAVDWANVPGVNPASKTYQVVTKAELDAAIASAVDGDTILLTADIDYTGTASLEINKAVTLDLGGRTLTTNGTYGGLRLKGNCSLKNGTLAHKGTVTAIKAWNVDAIEDVVIDVAFREGKTIGGIVIQEGSTNRIGTMKNVTIKGEGLTNGIETYNCGNATENVIGSMENVTIDANGTGMLISAPCGTATNCSINGDTTGIELWIKGTYSATLNLVNCDVTGGEKALYVHDEFTSDSSVVNNGTLKLTADDASTFVSENGKALEYTIARAENVELSENIMELRSLSGTGTEADPYLINNLEELKWFRDDVNRCSQDGSSQYTGKYIKLTADIDLDEDGDGIGEEWEPIGSTTRDHGSFYGTFDGDGHTISNLVVSEHRTGSGFFAKVSGGGDGPRATVKNINFHNVDVSSGITTGHDGSYVGGVIANAGGNSVISNVHVTGNVYVSGYGYVGGIVGHGYPKMDNCSVVAEDGSYVNAYYWCAGGLIGYAGEGGTVVKDCHVSGLDIWSAYGAAGAAVGLLQYGNKLDGVAAEDVTVTSNSDYCMGYVAGNGEESTLTNITATNVTATANGKPITATDAVAKVGDAVYFDLQEAIIAAAPAGTVDIVADVVVDEWKMFWQGDKTFKDIIYIDMNGLTINGNSHTLTVNSIVSSGNGNQLFKEATELNIHDLKINVVNGAGGIGLESGSIRNVTITGGTYGVYPGAGEILIEGCTFATNGTAIYYEAARDNLIVSGNTFELPKTANVIILRGNEKFTDNTVVSGRTVNVASGSPVVTGNDFGDVRFKVYNVATATIKDNEINVLEFSDSSTKVESTFGENTYSEEAEQALKDAGVIKEAAVVAKVGETEYTDLQTAINVAANGDVITVIADINLADTELQLLDGSYDTYFLVEGKTVTINLNGKTISGAYTGTNTMLVGVFSTNNNGHLTITGNGTVDVTATNKVYALVANYNPGCSITIENGTYKLDNAHDSLIFHGGNTDGAVTVKGGTFTLGNVGSGTNGKPWIFNVVGAGDHHVLITGGTFNADINRQHWSNEAVVDETCYTVDNGDGTYTVKDGAVAYVKTGMLTGGFFAPKNVGYATLTEAIAAAVAANDSPVVLVKDIVDAEEFAISANSSIVLDLNGYTLNGTIKPSTGDITVKNGSIVNSNSNYSAIEINSGKLTLENVNIKSARHAVRIDGAVEAVINGGEYKLIATSGTRHAVNVSGAAKVTIKDGTFIGPKGTTMDSGSAVCVQSGATVTIEGGNFAGGKLNTLGVSGTMSIIGGTFDQDPSAYVADDYAVYEEGEVGKYVVEEEKVAKIGDVKYKTLQNAVDEAQEGDVIVIRNNFDLDTIVTITNGKKITLDLNGKTITGIDNTNKNFSLIDNRGDLTITGNGKMTLTATINSGWNRYSAVLANNPGGKLVVENGTIEHLGGTDMAYGIDNLTNGKGTYAETVINGGTIKSTYRGIRQFLNGVEAQNILTVNGGTIEGANKSIWMQDPSKNANSGTLTVAEGAVLNGDVYLFVTEGSTEWPVSVSIAASAVNGEVLSANVPSGYEVALNNGVYSVEVAPVATVTDSEGNVTEYETLAAALKAAQTGDTITLLADIDLGTESITIGGKASNLTIDGAGHTITFDSVTNNWYDAAINPGGPGAFSVKNVTIELKNAAPNFAAFDMKRGGTLENVTVNGKFGKCVIAEGQNPVTVTGCTFNDADWGIYVDGVYSNVTVTGTTFNTTGAALLNGNAVFTGNIIASDSYVESTAAIDVSKNFWNGNNATGVAPAADQLKGDKIICDTYYAANNNGVLSDLRQNGEEEEPVIKVELIGGETYEYGLSKLSLLSKLIGSDAMNSAKITLLDDLTLENGIQVAPHIAVVNGEVVITPKTVEIDLNDKTLNGFIQINGNVTGTIKNGTVNNTNSKFAAIDVSGTATLEDLTVTSASEAFKVAEGADLTVKQGTYSSDPTAYVAEGYVVEYADGTYSVEEAPEVPAELFPLLGTNMVLGNALNMQFIFSQEFYTDWTGFYAVFTKEYADGRPDVVKTIPYSEWGTLNYEGKKHFYAAFDGIAAKEMSDNVSVTIYNADGVAVSKTATDSVKGYAGRIIGNSFYAENVWTMLTDMLNYGAAAQEEFGYGLDNLANAGITGEYASEAKECEVKTTVEGTAGYIYGSRLDLENSILLELVFNKEKIADGSYLAVSFTDHYGKAKTKTIEKADMYTEGNYYIATIDDIVAADGRQMITCELYDGEGNLIVTIEESVESYAARMGMAKLYENIMKFSDSAYAYFHS